MDDLDPRIVTLLRSAARRLTGPDRRAFQAEVANALCDGHPRLTEHRFGWGRQTVYQGQRETALGIRGRENFAARARPTTEAQQPELAQAIRQVVEPRTHADPELGSARRYTTGSAREVRQALIDQVGYDPAQLPHERTFRQILNRLGYRLKRVQKGKPLKRLPETDAIFANVAAAREQYANDLETREISRDAKAKVAEGDYSRGGKNANRCGRKRAQGA